MRFINLLITLVILSIIQSVYSVCQIQPDLTTGAVNIGVGVSINTGGFDSCTELKLLTFSPNSGK